MTRILLFTASALALSLTGWASQAGAQDAPRAAPDQAYPEAARAAGRRGGYALMRLGAADADGDGRVARAELEALRAEEFAYRDRDGDGAITLVDLSPTRQRLADMAGDDEGRLGRDALAGLDADNDGRVTRSEFMNAPTPVFDRLDADADGVVTGAEIDAGLQSRRDRRALRRDGSAWRRD